MSLSPAPRLSDDYGSTMDGTTSNRSTTGQRGGGGSGSTGSRYSPCPRMPSRSSNATLATINTTSSGGRSSNSSSSQNVPPSTSRPTAAGAGHMSPHSHSHRYHHSRCGSSSNGGSTRPASRLSREVTEDASEAAMAAAIPTVSSYLQDRLLRDRAERRADSAGLVGGRRSAGGSRGGPGHGDPSASLGDVRDGGFDATGSPVRRSATAMGRWPPRSPGMGSGGLGDDEGMRSSVGSGAGMGAKEFQQTVSTLSKQNFDLKLELFHRRERQSALEEENTKLEAEGREQAELHDSLIAELEKRDKAVGEAVAMINNLEARIEELIREREMVRIIEAASPRYHDRILRHHHDNGDGTESESDYEDGDRGQTPRPDNESEHTMSNAHLTTNDKVLDRMPSFLSERSEHTENLRNVVLNNKSSMFHLRKVSESSTTPSEVHRVASPSLSVLSESSFVSIYGAKEAAGEQTPVALPLASQSVESLNMGEELERGLESIRNWKPPCGFWDEVYGRTGDEQHQQTDGTSPERLLRATKQIQSAQMHSFADNKIPHHRSPVREVEMLGQRLRPRTIMVHNAHGPVVERSRQSPTRKSKQEKRLALQKVLTNGPPRDQATGHPLPPTPDTISSSVLRRFDHDSSDCLSRGSRVTSGDSRNSLGSTTLAATSSHGPSPRIPDSAHQHHPRLSSSTFDSFRHEQAMRQEKEAHVGLGLVDSRRVPPRPRSADASTISRSNRRPSSSLSDSDSDGGAAARSDEEQEQEQDDNFDYWMRESAKPDRSRKLRSTHHPGHPGKTTNKNNNGSSSPDLFSFPTGTAGAWEPDALYGAMRSAAFLDSPAAGLKRDPMDELLANRSGVSSPRQILAPSLVEDGPQPPDRRSSLHARTGSINTTATPVLTPTTATAQAATVVKSNKADSRRNSGSMFPLTFAKNRSNSIDSSSGPTTQKAQQAEAAPKRSMYPPITGQSQPGRAKGLGHFWRRSGSESQGSWGAGLQVDIPSSASGNGAAAAAAAAASSAGGRMSVPPSPAGPWSGRRTPVSGGDGNATPPPILRNRAGTVAGGEEGGPGAIGVGQKEAQEIQVAAPPTPQSAGGERGGGRLKWLGNLGRVGKGRS